MDDSRFDEILKGKLEGHEDDRFDPEALAGLHHQLASANFLPWYLKYRPELIMGAGLMVLSFVLIWNQQRSLNTIGALESQISELSNTHDQQLKALEAMGGQIEGLQSTQPDTIREVRVIERPVLQPDQIRLIQSLSEERSVPISSESLIYLGRKEAIPESTVTFLESQGLLLYDQKDVYLKTSQTGPVTLSKRTAAGGQEKIAVPLILIGPYKDVKEDVTPDKTSGNSLPVKTAREIQRHYGKGVGLRLGPTFEVSTTYRQGTEEMNYASSPGFLADFIMSPSISVESGAKLTHRYYEVDDPLLQNELTLPEKTNLFGELTRADVDSWYVEVPINLKYRYPISLTTRIKGSVGISSFLYHKQDFEYLFNPDNLENPESEAAMLTTSSEWNGFKYYPGAATFSLGIAHDLKNGKILEGGIFYQYPLGIMGEEGIDPKIYGLKTVYWFPIR